MCFNNILVEDKFCNDLSITNFINRPIIIIPPLSSKFKREQIVTYPLQFNCSVMQDVR